MFFRLPFAVSFSVLLLYIYILLLFILCIYKVEKFRGMKLIHSKIE